MPPKVEKKIRPITDRIIALWALAETMLGGILHAFNIPLTGYLVGGTAILCIGMIAYFESQPARSILRALLLVLILKAMISPQAPPMAYVAVAFQGLMGVMVFGIWGFRWWTCILFSVIALLESGMQKLFIMTLIYGMELWKALDSFGESVAQSFSISLHQDFSHLLILVYLSTYLIWGFLLGWFLWKLPEKLHLRVSQIKDWKNLISEYAPASGKKKSMRWLFMTGILLFVTFILMQAGNTRGAMYLIFRAVLMTVLLFFVIQPLLKNGLQKWLKRKSTRYSEELQQINTQLLYLGKIAGPLYRLCKTERRGWRVPAEFIIRMFVIAIYSNETDSDIQ